MEVIKSSENINKPIIWVKIDEFRLDFKDLLPELSKDIDECFFIAFDGEFSGKCCFSSS